MGDGVGESEEAGMKGSSSHGSYEWNTENVIQARERVADGRRKRKHARPHHRAGVKPTGVYRPQGPQG